MADFGGDAEAFRLEARTWLEQNFPESLRDAPMAQMAAAYGGMEERPDAKLWREISNDRFSRMSFLIWSSFDGGFRR